MIFYNSLNPLRYGVAEAAQVLSADVPGPHFQDGLLQLGEGGDVLGAQHVLHEVPGVLYRIHVRRIARPINDFQWLILQEVFYPFRGMEWGTVLKKCVLR